MITPPVEDFEIHPKATEVHGWTKEKLLALPQRERPSFAQAWSQLKKQLKICKDLLYDRNVILCAYNGFGFDFRILVHHWDYFGLRVQKNFILVDPWFDILVLEGKNVKLDKAFKDI